MRTTITLDPDVEALVHKAMRERKVTFKQAVNEALRRALASQPEDEPFRTPTFSMGRSRVNLDKALQLAGELEDEEIIRKMQHGK